MDHSVDEVIQAACSCACCQGIMFCTPNDPNVKVVPITLTPFPIEKETFQRVKDLMPHMNLLRDKVARDFDFLCEHLKEVAEADGFVNNLLTILKTVQKEGIKQTISCGFNRSDFMFDYDENSKTEKPQQVEINMIAASLSSFSEKVCKMHTYISNKFPTFSPHKSEPNVSSQRLPNLLATAHKAYGSGDLILFVTQKGEKSLDQMHIESVVMDLYSIPVVRLTMQQILDECVLKDGKLSFQGKIISLVYFRAGYGPADYIGKDEWAARLMIERSDAIKCPTVAYQLCGTKKIQQVLNNPKMMEKYIHDDQLISQFSACFTGIWSVGSENQKEIDNALKHPDLYVLKQQREGGGNLILGDHMKEILSNLNDSHVHQYVLMKKIRPLAKKVYFCRDGKVHEAMGVSELGIYGCFLGDGKKEIINEYGGYLMRSKMQGVEDGGVLAGAMYLDSLYLK
jgi:glutathione synthetase